MAKHLATCHTFVGRAINLTIALVFCPHTGCLGWEELGAAGGREVSAVYSMGPVLGLAAFTAPSLAVTRSRDAKRLQHFRIVLLAQRARSP